MITRKHVNGKAVAVEVDGSLYTHNMTFGPGEWKPERWRELPEEDLPDSLRGGLLERARKRATERAADPLATRRGPREP